MFVTAYQRASKFTAPVVTSMRLHDGTVESGLAAFVVVNDDGWIMTAAHVIGVIGVHAQHQTEIADYGRQVQAIDAGTGTPEGKAKRMRALKTNKKWIRNYSLWWGRDDWRVPKFEVLSEADLAIGQIDGFDPSHVDEYPVFKIPPDMEPGRSLCRLGYPFYGIDASYDRATDMFTFAPNTLPIPRFPIEGMLTRTLIGPPTESGLQVKLIETSSPGLRGQSGGPIFDVNGHIWGMQTQTRHLPLGFSPKVTRNGNEVEEHQFLNAGVGVHSQTIVSFLASQGVGAQTV